MAEAESGTSVNVELASSPGLYGSACDTCRRRRVKCQGGQPCPRCSKSGVACTYGSASSRTSSVSYARQLERKVADLEAELSRARSSKVPDVSEKVAAEEQQTSRKESVDMLIGPGDDWVYRNNSGTCSTYYGRWAGMRIIGAIGGLVQRAALSPNAPQFCNEMVDAFDSWTLDPPSIPHTSMLAMLPAKEDAHALKERAMETALICHDIVDHGEFVRHLAMIYMTDAEQYTTQDWTFISLLFIVMALAKRFEASETIPSSSQKIKLQGLGYYYASCCALNFADAFNLDSVRATIYQALYLISASMMTKAYTRLSGCVATALRMGLHISSRRVREKFSDEEMFQRRRIFAHLHCMDTYVSSLVGLPRTTRDIDAQQMLGLRNADLPDKGRAFFTSNPTSAIAETALLEKIGIVCGDIAADRHPILETGEEHMSDSSWDAAVELVPKREAELQDWSDSLSFLQFTQANTRTVQGQLTLRLYYSMTEMVLYRPFVHHLSRKRSDPEFNLRGYEWGSKCVKAAMQVVWICERNKAYDLFHEAQWHMIYSLCFSATVLTYFVTLSTQTATVKESAMAALNARRMLGDLGEFNMVARRCYNALKGLMDDLPVSWEGLQDDVEMRE